MVQEAVEEADGGGVLGQEASPLVEGPVGGDAEGAAKERQLAAQIMKGKVGEQAALFDTNSGIRLMNIGDLEGAVSQFEAALKISPDNPLAHYQLGRALERQGKREEAKAHLKRAAELDPHYR